MTNALQAVVDLMKLREIAPLVFVGDSQDLGFPQLFGGQVLGQGLMAAARSIAGGLQAHSLHGYFLERGAPTRPVQYEVNNLRNGTSFATRWVVAKQEGLAIFCMTVSFHRFETGPEHQLPMPAIPGPEGLVNEVERLRQVHDQLPPASAAKLTADRAIEIRAVEPLDLFTPTPRPPFRQAWFRTTGPLIDDPLLHQALLAYASDFGLAATSLRPHGITFRTPGMRLASLDHSLWFHRPARVDEWLIHTMDSPTSAGARGFNRGQIYTRAGELVASTAQEGLMRPSST